MAALTGRLLRNLAAVTAVIVVGHDLVYTAAYGPAAEAARRASGHTPYWGWTWLAVALATAVLVAAGLAVAIRLVLRAVAVNARPQWALSPYFRALLRLWPRLAIVAALAFGIQENFEHYATHGGHLPGWAVLWSGDYASTLPAFGLVALLVAAGIALFAGTMAALEAAVQAARSVQVRAPLVASRPAWADFCRRPYGTLATPDLGRAPPA